MLVKILLDKVSTRSLYETLTVEKKKNKKKQVKYKLGFLLIIINTYIKIIIKNKILLY